MLEYPDSCLTAGYPIRLGVTEGVAEVVASADGAVGEDEDPGGVLFADAVRVARVGRLLIDAGLVPVLPHH